MRVSKQFRADVSALDQMMDWIRRCLSCFSSRSKRVELALEEALMNVIYYAYAYPPGVLEIVFYEEKASIVFQINDWGVPFNPLEEIKTFKKSLLADRQKEGGLGIYLMVKMVDDIFYKRENGKNILTLKQRRTSF